MMNKTFTQAPKNMRIITTQLGYTNHAFVLIACLIS